MKHKFINQLKEGEKIEDTYLVREKSLDLTRGGDYYITLELVDRTGMVDAKFWNASQKLFNSFSVDDFVRIRGMVELYKGYPQVNLDLIERKDEREVNISEYIPSTTKDIDQMFNSLQKSFGEIKNQYILELLKGLFLAESISEGFKHAPAATDFHHPYIGGLLEHTLSCIELCYLIIPRYPRINKDLLLAGTILHDIGKIEELSYKRTFYYTDRGRLLGHIILGIMLVEAKIAKIIDFPEDLKNLLLHIILSHHGEYEWGSPKRPMCLEAIVLHYIDNLDAKIGGFEHFVDTYNINEQVWTKHSKMFKEFLYKGLQKENT